jgi:hypothetical protein
VPETERVVEVADTDDLDTALARSPSPHELSTASATSTAAARAVRCHREHALPVIR